jgi:hypothetical protein
MSGRSGTLRRRQPQREPKPEIVVVCEGKVTEPRYFEDFKALSGNSLVTVTPIGGCGVPVSVVERAIEVKHERERAARRSRDSFDLRFEVWAVFDRDAHPDGQVPRAFALAEKNGVLVAYSNPCFEVWGLMHFACYARPGHHHECQAELRRQLHGFCHEKNPVFDVRLLERRYADAVRNAERALKERENEGTLHGDPSTSVFLLTERIRKYGKS